MLDNQRRREPGRTANKTIIECGADARVTSPLNFEEPHKDLPVDRTCRGGHPGGREHESRQP